MDQNIKKKNSADTLIFSEVLSADSSLENFFSEKMEEEKLLKYIKIEYIKFKENSSKKRRWEKRHFYC